MSLKQEREDLDQEVLSGADNRMMAMMAVRDSASGHVQQAMYLCGRAWDLAHDHSTTNDESTKLMNAFWAISNIASA